MNSIPTSKWLATHIHYNEPWEEFLVNAVLPYTKTVMQTGIAECFYYERSWKRGPHIRLYIKGNETVVNTLLQPNMVEHFEYHFNQSPSLLTPPSYPDNFPDKYKWLPNNSLQIGNI